MQKCVDAVHTRRKISMFDNQGRKTNVSNFSQAWKIQQPQRNQNLNTAQCSFHRCLVKPCTLHVNKCSLFSVYLQEPFDLLPVY